jgi:hypothetical protein
MCDGECVEKIKLRDQQVLDLCEKLEMRGYVEDFMRFGPIGSQDNKIKVYLFFVEKLYEFIEKHVDCIVTSKE